MPKSISTQRLFDLVRHQRAELHDEGLITDEEYAMLASEQGAVERLETYDELVKERDVLRVALNQALARIGV